MAAWSINFPGASPGFLSRNPSSRPTPSNNIKSLQTLGLGGSYHLCSSLLKTANKSLQSAYVTTKRGFVVCFSSIDPVAGGSLPSGPPHSNSLKGWAIGILLSVVIPFLRHKLGSFKQIRNVIDTIEEVVHDVEKVAEVVDKVAEEIGENLPAGKLKDAVKSLERAAEKVDKDAETLGELIDKVEEVEEKLEESLIHHQASPDDKVGNLEDPKDGTPTSP